MFVALAVLKLVEEEQISLSDKLKDLAPEVRFYNAWENSHPIQLAHLLEHTTGWDDMSFKEMSHTASPEISLRESLSLYPETRISRWQPGSRMSYSNIGPVVAAYIVEKITEIPFEKYIEKTFFLPLSMNSATSFQPSDTQAAVTYLNNKPLDFWNVIYRPSGSISASIIEMTQLLKFFIQRGEYNQQRILQSKSIDRMEISKTTPGYKQGLLSGYGLANYTSGFLNKSYSFHGHSGGLPGGYANLAYNSEHKSGFVLLLTGSGQAFYHSISAIKEYLTRNHKNSTRTNLASQETLNEMTGFYKSISPRNESLKIIDNLIGLVQFSNIENHLQVNSIAGSITPPIKYSLSKDKKWIDESSGLASIALISDPTYGQVVQVGPQFLKPISNTEAWLKIGFVLVFFILLLCSIIYAIFWIPFNLYHKTFKETDTLVRLWPLLSGICLLIFIILFQLGIANPIALGNINAKTMTIFVLSVLYPILSLWGMKYLIDNHHTIRPYIFRFSAILITAHIFSTAYLAYYGIIGFRTWA